MADTRINNSDPQVMIEIAREINQYADGLEKDLNRLMKRHDGMSREWSGDQYDSFTDILRETRRELMQQVEKFRLIALDVQDDAKALAAAQGITLRMR